MVHNGKSSISRGGGGGNLILLRNGGRGLSLVLRTVAEEEEVW